MPTPTYTPLATVTLGTTAATVTFASIPATYRDLILVCVAGFSNTAITARVRFNADFGSNYSFQSMRGNGTDASARSASANGSAFLSDTTPAATTTRLQLNVSFMDYSATNKHKTLLSRADNSSAGTDAIINTWANTAAITSMAITPSAGTWSIGSTFNLYGVIA
jgi:hypothetical protein